MAPTVLKLTPRWHLVTGGVTQVASADGDEMAVITNRRGPAPLGSEDDFLESLLNLRSHQQTPVTPPGCDETDPGDTSFGGPWFAVSCDSPFGEVDLLNLHTGQWHSITFNSPLCRYTSCLFDSVGGRWIRFVAVDEPGNFHTGVTPYLQNIATGAVEADPPNGAVHDSLNTQSGTTTSCLTASESGAAIDNLAALQYGAVGHQLQLGHLVLTTSVDAEVTVHDHLYTCGSSHVLRLPQFVAASTQAIVWNPSPEGSGNGGYSPFLAGLLLPQERRFVLEHPKGDLEALTGRTVFDITQSDQLWAATLPAT